MTDPKQPVSLPPALARFSGRELDDEIRRAFLESLAALNPSDRSTLFELLEELIGASPKSAAIGLRNLADVLRTLGPTPTLSWLDLGTAMASRSSAAAQKYFSESPDLLSEIPPLRRLPLLRLGLELSDGHAGVIMDFLRACPHLPAEVGTDDLTVWMETGRRLAEEDTVLAVEYFRISPMVLRQIPIGDLPRWVELGRRLVEPNTLGKPDYLKAIEFFRLSTETLASLEPPDLRKPFLELGVVLSWRSAALGMDYLRSAPTILREIEAPGDRRLFLSQALRLAEAVISGGRSGEERTGSSHAPRTPALAPAEPYARFNREPGIVLDYLREGSKAFRTFGYNTADFMAWVDAGLTLLTVNPERARAFFSGRSKTGQETAERLMGGLSLKTVGRTLALYAEGLSGRAVAIKPTTDLPESLRETVGDAPTGDGRTIYLPSRIRLYPDDEDNFRLYKTATLHEAGHLEFGTYQPDFAELRDLIQEVRAEYARLPLPVRQAGDGRGQDLSDSGSVQTAADYFNLFPSPVWARSLWTVIEDARVDFRIRADYPGARRDMDRIVAMDLESRPKLEGLPPRAAVYEALLQLSVTDTTEVPLELAETVSAAYDLLLEVKSPAATAVDSLKVLARLYRFLEEQFRRWPAVKGESDPLGVQEKTPDPHADPAADPTAASPRRETRPSPSTFSYRGVIQPDRVRSGPEEKTVPIDPGRFGSVPPASSAGESQKKTLETAQTEGAPKEIAPDPGFQNAPTHPEPAPDAETATFLYDEWDDAAQEYRPRWCRLREHRLQPGSSQTVRQTLTSYAPVLRLLRRHFQSLRPEAFRKVKRQAYGDQLDLDAIVEARTELRSGQTPRENLYIKNEKLVRDVAVAFLIDLSGSTSRQIPSARKRVIDVEQEALILMAEALEAVGDAFAIYGFSGDSKDRVDFYIIKDFSDAVNPLVHERIGAMRSMNQNRDGTAIRHTLAKLEQQPAKTRLLLLISDGKPLDAGYAGAYSLQDTKRALREARMRGVHPYCITVDREASRYVTEMYGEVGHTIIDRVATLPDRLPRIYKRLTT